MYLYCLRYIAQKKINLKFKTNIPALFLALLVFGASNGIVLSEHICNTSNSRNFSFLTNASCDMEKPVSSCCKQKKETKNNCCQHKQFFKKLPIEGFVANQINLKPFDKIVLKDYFYHSFSFLSLSNVEKNISGIPPPDNLYQIKYLLRPTSVGLQTFRC